MAAITQVRTKHHLGDVIITPELGFTGRITAIFMDYEAAWHSGIVQEDWFEQRTKPLKPSTKYQPFYYLGGEGKSGGVLIGENEIFE